MKLQKFALPKTDTRLITVDDMIYKIKLHLVKHSNRNEKSYEEFFSNPKYQEEIEDIIIVLLTCKDEPPLPIRSNNLTVYPYRKTWEIADKLQFYRNKTLLKTCPYVYYFYIESKLPLLKNHHGNNGIPVKNNTKQTSHHSQGGQNHQGKTLDDAKTINQAKSKPQDNAKCGQVEQKDKIQLSKEAKNTDQETRCIQPVDKRKLSVPQSSLDKAYDESESEDGSNQSISILDGIQTCDVSSPENLSPLERLSSSEDESLIYSTARNQAEMRKQDMPPEKMKSCKPIKLIPAHTITSRRTRKRHGEVLDEAEPRKKNYSVTEYLDANRHEVQEQDLQELLRFQELATPTEEKPAIGIEEKRGSGSLQRVFSSVKRLMFG